MRTRSPSTSCITTSCASIRRCAAHPRWRPRSPIGSGRSRIWSPSSTAARSQPPMSPEKAGRSAPRESANLPTTRSTGARAPARTGAIGEGGAQDSVRAPTPIGARARERPRARGLYLKGPFDPARRDDGVVPEPTVVERIDAVHEEHHVAPDDGAEPEGEVRRVLAAEVQPEERLGDALPTMEVR